MGMDAGFDMVPRLTQGAVDVQKWKQFVKLIRSHYKDNMQVEIKPNYILFKAGERPSLPLDGHKLLRFSSKVSGSIAANSGVEAYINTVTRIAKARFGSAFNTGTKVPMIIATIAGMKLISPFDLMKRSMDEPDVHTSITSFINGVDPLKELDVSLFEVKDIPGKGRGLVARFNLSKGTRMLCEKPLLTAVPMSREEFEVTLATRLRSLPKDSQRQFLSLHNKSPGSYPFSIIFKTNNLLCGLDSVVGGVYPTICLINHSCMLNSHNNWNKDEKHETIYAICPIKAGEEITIPYDHGRPSAERQTFLRESFGFNCRCHRCSGSSSELQDSDTRSRQIQSLDGAIGDPMNMMGRPKESLRDCLALLQVPETEYEDGAAPLTARLYYNAFQVSIALGDQARASVFADRAYQARVVCVGEDSPETQRVKAFALKPANHASYGLCSMKWGTKRGIVPQGLDAVQFEKWLFRQ